MTCDHARFWRRLRRPPRPGFAPWLGLCAALLTGCVGSYPESSPGVARLDVEGMEAMDQRALTACLATHERERFGFVLGGESDPVCGEPPFEARGKQIDMWIWPWTDWPDYDSEVFERDLDRVVRWYEARGYYETRIVSTEARMSRAPGPAPWRGWRTGGPKPRKQELEIALDVRVEEGKPVIVSRIDVEGDQTLPRALKQELRDAIELKPKERFDETAYERSKRAMLDVLLEASYARAEVSGDVLIDEAARDVVVTLRVVSGGPCKFGDVSVADHGDLPAKTIWAAAGIESGTAFRMSTLRDAQRAVYDLGPVAAVEMERNLRADEDVVDVVIRVVPSRAFRWGVGVGIQSGGLQALNETSQGTGDSFAQWDVHLLGKLEHRNFLGGMRKLQIEERPRMIFGNPFPDASQMDLGNLLTMNLRQPAFFEPRTALVLEARWDRGPDPYGGRFLRDDVVTGIGPERYFFGNLLYWKSSVNADFFVPLKDDAGPYPPYSTTYLTHLLRIDLRDNPHYPLKGTFFRFQFQHSGYVLPSDWTYFKINPDVRGYVSLVGRMVLAARVRLGYMKVTRSTLAPPPAGTDPDEALLTERLIALGPINQRLRGGGHYSVRGYLPNELGDAIRVTDDQGNERLDSGGLRQWEASVELRIPLSRNLSTALFTDIGDVTTGDAYRFDHLQTTFGMGIRYDTLVGPLRLDMGLAPPKLQVIGPDDRTRTGLEQPTVFGFPGTVHFTIGEPF
jgi:outer membrane protein assembly factor BamA